MCSIRTDLQLFIPEIRFKGTKKLNEQCQHDDICEVGRHLASLRVSQSEVSWMELNDQQGVINDS